MEAVSHGGGVGPVIDMAGVACFALTLRGATLCHHVNAPLLFLVIFHPQGACYFGIAHAVCHQRVHAEGRPFPLDQIRPQKWEHQGLTACTWEELAAEIPRHS